MQIPTITIQLGTTLFPKRLQRRKSNLIQFSNIKYINELS